MQEREGREGVGGEGEVGLGSKHEVVVGKAFADVHGFQRKGSVK